MTGSVFGPMLSAHVVEDAVVDTVALWLPTYLAEVERQQGLPPGGIARPASLSTRSLFEVRAEESLPAIVVVSPGTAGTPERAGDRTQRAQWVVDVVAVVSAPTDVLTRRMGQLYAAALRTLLLQRSSLGGVAARGLTWLGDSYTPIPSEGARTIYGAAVQVLVRMDAVVDGWGGPPPASEPGEDPLTPWPSWPTITDVGITVERTEAAPTGPGTPTEYPQPHIEPPGAEPDSPEGDDEL